MDHLACLLESQVPADLKYSFYLLNPKVTHAGDSDLIPEAGLGTRKR